MTIDFYIPTIQDDTVARRDWPAVPRVGDAVRLRIAVGLPILCGVVARVQFADHVTGAGNAIVDKPAVAVTLRSVTEEISK